MDERLWGDKSVDRSRLDWRSWGAAAATGPAPPTILLIGKGTFRRHRTIASYTILVIFIATVSCVGLQGQLALLLLPQLFSLGLLRSLLLILPLGCLFYGGAYDAV